MIGKDEFEEALLGFKFQPTDDFSEDGFSRKWIKSDGEVVILSVFDEYPKEYLEWVLDEYVGNIPIYTSNL